MTETMCDITLTVNGETVGERVEARKSLVDFLREDLALTGSHVGCEHGVCGACTVRVDGVVVRGCLMLAAQCDGAQVETIEGISDTGEIADLQAAFEQRNALHAVLPPWHSAHRAGMRRTVQFRAAMRSRASVRELLRCTVYHAIIDAGSGVEAVQESEMKIAAPPRRPLRARPAEFLYRPLGSAAQSRPPGSGPANSQRRHASPHGYVADVRSPYSHARISDDTTEAKKAPGVIAAVTGVELSKVIPPWVGVLSHLKGLKSAPQHALAVERACWQGEAVCAVVAKTRAQAEDACELVKVDYEELTPVTDAETALDPETPVIHPDLGDNLTFERKLDAGQVDKAFSEADAVVETTFVFGRHTGVTNEPRAIVADWNPGEQRLTVYHGTQAPHMMMNLFAKHLGLEEHQVRVITKDVGGSFGIKVHT